LRFFKKGRLWRFLIPFIVLFDIVRKNIEKPLQNIARKQTCSARHKVLRSHRRCVIIKIKQMKEGESDGLGRKRWR